jgi:hypothetical protein
VEWVDQFLSDLEECVGIAKTMKSGELASAVKEGLSDVNLDELSDETFTELLGMAGIEDNKLPERMADINEILNALTPEFRERLLVEFVNNLFR